MDNKLFHIPSVQNLAAYKSAVRAIGDLDAAEESKLAQDMQSNTATSIISAQKLILSQLKTVVKTAYDFKNYGLDEADLIQEGNIGLMRAVKNFDPSKNVRLYTFSLIWIRSEMQAYIIKNWKMVKIATTKNLKKLFFNYRSMYRDFEHQGVPRNMIPQKIIKSLDVSEKDIKDISSYFSQEDYSTDVIDMPDDEHTYSVPTALIEHQTPETHMIEYRDSQRQHQAFEEALETLGEREKKIIEYRFLTEPKKTHKEISKELNLSSERVRQIEQETIEKLKNTVTV